jgi:hypothetical protein
MTGDASDAEAAGAGARALAGVLRGLNAKEGQLCVVVVMEECDRGSLQTLLSKAASAASRSAAAAGGAAGGGAGAAGGTYSPFSGGGRYAPGAALRALVVTAKEVALVRRQGRQGVGGREGPAGGGRERGAGAT